MTFPSLATVTASTKRSAAASGKIGAPSTYLSSLKVTPLYPVDAEIRQRFALDTPHELLETYVPGAPDILEGDILTVAGVDYPIRSVAEWNGPSIQYRLLLLENLKK